MTRLFALGALLLASACTFHTHETVVVQPTQPVYVKAPKGRAAQRGKPGHAVEKERARKDRHARAKRPDKRRPAHARPGPAEPGRSAARPTPGKRAETKPGERQHPKVDRSSAAPRLAKTCKRAPEKSRKRCLPKRERHPTEQHDG